MLNTIADSLTQKGAQVDYNDPYIPKIKPKREYTEFVGKESVSVNVDDGLGLGKISGGGLLEGLATYGGVEVVYGG